MTKPQRTLLFSICALLFLILAPLVVFYSSGYRIDWENKAITQTGGFFAKVWPKQIDIYLDGKLVKKTDFLFGSALVENLVPKKYKIKISKDGYCVWEKTLKVDVRQVAEAKNIILFPQKIDLSLIDSDIKNFWLSQDQRKVVMQEETEKGWNLKLYDINKNIKVHLLKEGDLSSSKVDLLDLSFSQDSNLIEIKITTKERLKKFSIDLTKTSPTVKEIKINEPPENIIAYKKTNNEFYYLDSLGFVYRIRSAYDEKTSFETFIKNSSPEKLNDKTFKIQQETDYQLMPLEAVVFNTNQKYFFLKENDILYQLNPETKSFEKFFEGIRELALSPDSKKILYFSNNEIWLLFLRDIETPPQRKAGEKLLLMRVPEGIENCFWMNSNYLLFTNKASIKAIEIDNRDRINTATLIEIKNPEILWNKVDKKIYFLNEGKLYNTQSLLP